MNSERTRHAAKLRFMNEIHAVEDQLSQAKHTANLRRLQELIITETGYRDSGEIILHIPSNSTQSCTTANEPNPSPIAFAFHATTKQYEGCS